MRLAGPCKGPCARAELHLRFLPRPSCSLLMAGLLGWPGLLCPARDGGSLPSAAPLTPAARCELRSCGAAADCWHAGPVSQVPLRVDRLQTHSSRGGWLPRCVAIPSAACLCRLLCASCFSPPWPCCLLPRRRGAASAQRYGSSKSAGKARELESCLGVLLVDFLRLYGRALNNMEVGLNGEGPLALSLSLFRAPLLPSVLTSHCLLWRVLPADSVLL